MPEDNRLNHLLTYTTFHIGVYVTLGASLIGADIFTKLDHYVLRFSAFFFILVAGICGGVVGTNIPSAKSYEELAADRIAPWGAKVMPLDWWTTIEHLAFWAAILPLAVGYILFGPDVFSE